MPRDKKNAGAALNGGDYSGNKLKTEILSADDPLALAAAAEIIRGGGVVAFPTETVYGLGADALNADAVKEIFALKGRAADNPLIVHCASVGDVGRVAEVTPRAEKLTAAAMPGPLTLVLKKNPRVPDAVTAGLSTVAVRIPDDRRALALLAAAGVPLAAPSANKSGAPSPTEARHVYEDFRGEIPLILDGGACRIGVESTVIDLSGGRAAVLRYGGFPVGEIAALLGEDVVTRRDNGDAPMSPGTKYRHYAPACPVVSFRANAGTRREIAAEYDKYAASGRGAFIIAAESADGAYGGRKAVYFGGNAEAAARSLFKLFRERGRVCDAILCEELSDASAAGAAYNDRVRRASNGAGGG